MPLENKTKVPEDYSHWTDASLDESIRRSESIIQSRLKKMEGMRAELNKRRNHVEPTVDTIQFGERPDMVWAGMRARLDSGKVVQAALISVSAKSIKWVEPDTNGAGRVISDTDLNGVDHNYVYDYRQENHVAEWEQPTPEQLTKPNVLWLVLRMAEWGKRKK